MCERKNRKSCDCRAFKTAKKPAQLIEALPGGEEKGVSGAVVKRMRVLYRIEEKLKEQNADLDLIKRVRQEEAKPLLEKLNVYLSDRAIKPFVCSRKNWLFANSIGGANASARLFSLIETAKANGLNPFTYFTHIFKDIL